MSSNDSPNTSPKGRKLSKKLLSFSAKKTPKVEVPAYRFISTMQGHGYPVPLTAAPQAQTAHAAASGAKVGFLNLLKRDHHTTKKAAAETVPAYRFISSMAGYGCPYPTEATPAVAKPAAKSERMSLAKVPFVAEFAHALKKEKATATAEVAVPEYRFMVSMQGHGYPIPQSTVTTPPAPRRKTLLNLLKREPTIGHKAATTTETAPAPVTPAVPAYRFISSLAGHGCPLPTDATPLVAAKADKHHKASAVGGLFGGLTAVFRRSPAHHEETPAAAPAVETETPVKKTEVPAYRFIVSMQGHGCPIPESTVGGVATTATSPAGSPDKKKKKGFLSSLLGMFKPKAHTAAVGQA